jgi:hypothetical protein
MNFYKTNVKVKTVLVKKLREKRMWSVQISACVSVLKSSVCSKSCHLFFWRLGPLHSSGSYANACFNILHVSITHILQIMYQIIKVRSKESIQQACVWFAFTSITFYSEVVLCEANPPCWFLSVKLLLECESHNGFANRALIYVRG